VKSERRVRRRIGAEGEVQRRKQECGSGRRAAALVQSEVGTKSTAARCGSRSAAALVLSGDGQEEVRLGIFSGLV
jgi:hypothetical protein